MSYVTPVNRLLGFGEPATPTRARADGSIWAAPWAVPAAGEQTVLVQTSYGIVPIGWVQSALRVLDDAPNQREGAPRAWIRLDEQVAEGAKDLRPGDEIVVLTWLHLSPRDELSTHPEDEMSQPLTGVFSTCSPNWPNPIGLHRAASWRATGFGLKSTLWRQSTGRRWWTSSRPSTRPHNALHAAVLSGDLTARNRTSR
jgi:hypothetical protein